MRSSLATVALACAALATSLSAQDEPESWQPPATDMIVADAEGLCNTKASKNFFTQFDAKAWRSEFRYNCWWPAFEGRSRYFIKVYDWGSGPPQPLIAAPSYRPPSIDVWVQGQHREDASVPYRRSLTLYRIACARGTNRYAAVQFIAYDAADKLVEQWERPAAQSRAAIPNSKEEAFTSAVCN